MKTSIKAEMIGVERSNGYRKFFNTYAEQVMKPLNVERLMGHK